MRAEKCGHCDEPIPEKSVSGEWCSPKCVAAWVAANADQIHRFIGPVPVVAPPTVDPAPEPGWIAAWSGWEKAKAAGVIKPRQVPDSGVDRDPIHPLTPAPGMPTEEAA